MSRFAPIALVLSAVVLLGMRCDDPPRSEPTRFEITAPGKLVETFDFEVAFTLTGEFDPDTLSVELNKTDVRSRFSGGPTSYTALFSPGAPLRDINHLKVRVKRKKGGTVTAVQNFKYLPPGKARAREIKKDEQRITGPLGHSRIGDWILENGRARFAIQDVGQRELYSVGQYGGNLIDAELVGNEGRDNFLEVQPGLNVETVVNAQILEVVNDGEDGTAAMIRTCGPDDLLDFVNPSSQVVDLGIPFPEMADDFDMEVEACTTYALEPDRDPTDPQDFVRIETEVFNNEPATSALPDPLPLVVGDWLNPAGELETIAHSAQEPPGQPPTFFAPRANGIGPPVTTTLGAIGFFGFDEAAGTDYAYVRKAGPSPATFAFISGVLVILHQDNVIMTLLGSPPTFRVPRGGSQSFTRYFGVGDGDGSSAIELESRVNETAVGTLSGCVTSGGAPLAGAKVTAGVGLLSEAGPTSVFTTRIQGSFVTKPGPCPNYSGRVRSGALQIAAAKNGFPYVGGGKAPAIAVRNLPPDGFATVDFDLPPAGKLVVNAVDEAGQPIPARVTVVGFDPSPEPLRAGPELPGFGGGSLGLFYDAADRLPFGIVAVGHTGASGTTEFDLEPGVEAYHVYVSRGTEYSAFRTADPITVTGGATTQVDARITRVLETDGFISSDFHVHGIRSADSRVSDTHRVEAYSSEGVENVVMTDHHVHTDLRPAIADAGLSGFLTATIGEEITTFDYGHFNAYPLQIDSASPSATFSPDGSTQLSGGSTDWARPAPPGMDFPSAGAFNSTPQQIFELATAGPLSTPFSTIQINHIGSHFDPLKIDTSLVPPADLMTDQQRANRRLPDTGTVPNLFYPFPAVELWNGEDRGSQRSFLLSRIGIWFNLLNQGYPTTFIADTDSHTFTNLNSAGARTWTASPTDDPSLIDSADVGLAVQTGRAVGGQGVYVQTQLLATDGSGDTADLTHGWKTEMTDSGGTVDLVITVQSPAWAKWDRIAIYANAETSTAGSPYAFGATPTLVLREGDCDPTTTGDGDFDITVTQDIGGVPGADRWSATVTERFAGLTEETWFVAVVNGSDGVCGPMFPVYPDDLLTDSNKTIEDLSDGNVGELGVMALGATNALTFVP